MLSISQFKHQNSQANKMKASLSAEKLVASHDAHMRIKARDIIGGSQVPVCIQFDEPHAFCTQRMNKLWPQFSNSGEEYVCSKGHHDDKHLKNGCACHIFLTGAPSSITFAQFIYSIRKKIKLKSDEAVFMMTPHTNTMPPAQINMLSLYKDEGCGLDDNKSPFLILKMVKESTFG